MLPLRLLTRASALLDSVVARPPRPLCSTSFLTPAFSKVCAVQLAYGIYALFGFAPTRLTTADPLAEILSTEAVHGLGELPFRRDLASWARLSRLSLGLLGHPVQVAPYPGELAVEVAVGAVADVLQACGRVFRLPKTGAVTLG